MISFKLIVAICIFYCKFAWSSNSACSISFPRKNDTNQPLILENSSNLLRFPIPVNGSVELHAGELVGLFCPRGDRIIKNTVTWASCAKNETLQIQNELYNFSDVECSGIPSGTVVETNENCGNGAGKVFLIGFQVSENQWTSLMKVCYNQTNVRTIYVEHTLHSKAIRAITKQRFRPRFSQSAMNLTASVHRLYTQKAQLLTFTNLLGSKEVARRYIVWNRSYLARGHLAPKADMIYPAWQATTFFFINACPQWNTINSGSWSNIENHIRKTAINHTDPFKIYTGTHELLNLPDINENLQEIHLHHHQKKIPVPKFLWKIVYAPKAQKALAFVVVNNAFLTKMEPGDVLCRDLCNYRLKSSKLGFFYCCDVRELQKNCSSIPKLTVNGILNDFVLTNQQF